MKFKAFLCDLDEAFCRFGDMVVYGLSRDQWVTK